VAEDVLIEKKDPVAAGRREKATTTVVLGVPRELKLCM
jgi:hypothetical protein